MCGFFCSGERVEANRSFRGAPAAGTYSVASRGVMRRSEVTACPSFARPASIGDHTDPLSHTAFISGHPPPEGLPFARAAGSDKGTQWSADAGLGGTSRADSHLA